jgi:hypothetical protein
VAVAVADAGGVTAPDAAVVAAELPVDAAVAVVVPEPEVAPDAGRRASPRPARADAGARVVVAPAPDAAPVVRRPAGEPRPSGPGTVEDFTARYRRVGAALDGLARAKGQQQAEPLRRRYFAIPFSDALREPSLRADAVQKLWQLEREIGAAAQ